jgi:hypothetical protein
MKNKSLLAYRKLTQKSVADRRQSDARNSGTQLRGDRAASSISSVWSNCGANQNPCVLLYCLRTQRPKYLFDPTRNNEFAFVLACNTGILHPDL